MSVLTLYNTKGGVGKTSAAVNLAYAAARDGYRTLVWDLDPQAAASFYFRVRPRLSGGSRKLVAGKIDLAAEIKGTDFELLDLLPADPSFRRLGEALADAKKADRRVDRLLDPFRREYEFIFLDAPPTMDRLAEALFTASDTLLIPVVPTPLSLRALEQIRQFLDRKPRYRAVPRPFFSLVDRRKLLHRTVAETAGSDGFLEHSIPYASEVELMGVRRAPLGHFAPGSRAAKAFDALWAEVRRLTAPGPPPGPPPAMGPGMEPGMLPS